jgi:hypothetical protein
MCVSVCILYSFPTTICVSMCPQAAIYVSSCYYMCPHATHATICVLILLCVLIQLYVSSDYYICVLILLYMCPHATIYVASLCRWLELVALLLTQYIVHSCPHTTIYVAAYYHILQYTFPHFAGRWNSWPLLLTCQQKKQRDRSLTKKHEKKKGRWNLWPC